MGKIFRFGTTLPSRRRALRFAKYIELFINMSIESVPRELKNLRACLLCGIIKTFEQFELDGCDNCDQ